MSRGLVWLAALLLIFPGMLCAWNDDGPPISITSPQNGTTYPKASIKNRALIWNKGRKMLIVCVTFTDNRESSGSSNDDTHYFDLPGVTFDEAKGIFYAASIKGESIPVAHIKKALFMKSIEVTPNAIVRVMYPRGDITVRLEAISPNDPAMHPKPIDPDATHDVPIKDLLQQ